MLKCNKVHAGRDFLQTTLTYLSIKTVQLTVFFFHQLPISFDFVSFSVFLWQSVMRGRRSGLALTPDLCLSILQKVSNLPRQTLKLLLKLGLNHALQLRKMKEEQTERHENVHIICSIYTKCHLSLIFFITYFSNASKSRTLILYCTTFPLVARIRRTLHLYLLWWYVIVSLTFFFVFVCFKSDSLMSVTVQHFFLRSTLGFCSCISCRSALCCSTSWSCRLVCISSSCRSRKKKKKQP